MCFSVEVSRDFKKLSDIFKATVDKKAFYDLDSMKRKMPDVYKTPSQDNRVYPNYFAPIILNNSKNERFITPMRYRVMPHYAEKEVPSKYNLFNARYDSLTTRKTWKSLIGRNHGLFPFTKFYEWVDVDGKKKLISFFPKNRDIMWAPCLYDHWQDSKKQYSITSFAIITDDPPKEILEKGHDRCPIFLSEKFLDSWLNPNQRNINEVLDILKNKEETFFESNFL